MTAREYKRLCRIKVVKLVRLIKYIVLVAWFTLAEYYQVHYAISTIIGIWLWEYSPLFIAKKLEELHKINHDWVKWG